MGSPARTTKGKRVKDVLNRLGVTEEEIRKVPQISHLFAKIGGAVKVFEYLQGSADPDARRILDVMGNGGEFFHQGVPLEAFCLAAEVPTQKAFGIIASEVLMQSGKESALIAAVYHPMITQTTIDSALVEGKEGAVDRKMLHQHAQFLPMPKTQVLHLHGHQAQTVAPTALPALEDSVQRMSARFNSQISETKSLPPASDGIIEEAEEEE